MSRKRFEYVPSLFTFGRYSQLRGKKKEREKEEEGTQEFD